MGKEGSLLQYLMMMVVAGSNTWIVGQPINNHFMASNFELEKQEFRQHIKSKIALIFVQKY